MLYTAHYMEEAERLCDRVGIIDEGEIKAEGTRRELVRRVGERDRVHIEVAGSAAGSLDGLRDLAGVSGALVTDGTIEMIVDDASAVLADALRVVTESGVPVAAVSVEQPDLEAVFLQVTGQALRD